MSLIPTSTLQLLGTERAPHSMASAAEARALYRAFLRCARHFGTSYNVKE